MKKEEYTYLGGLFNGIGTLLTGMKTTMKVYFRKKITEQYPEDVRPFSWHTEYAT